MNGRRDFFKGAAALAALAALPGSARAASRARPGNNQIWLMTSAFPGKSFEQVLSYAKAVGAQGLELCVFRRDSDRKDHTATHLDYETFDLEAAKRVVARCNETGLRVSVGAYDNLIGGKPENQVVNQNHILRLIRIAALLGGDENDVVCGSFVGYDHELGRQDGGFEKNLVKFQKVFTPIAKYAEDLGVTLCFENCPMEGWQPVTAPDCYNNLPGCLAARKLMYTLVPSKALAETYDPSHDIWQHIDPCAVIEATDMGRLRRIHIKGTRNFPDSPMAIHWGRLFPAQSVDGDLAKKAGVPLPANEWDRCNYEPRLPGFGGSDSLDWTKFLETLMARGFKYPFVIENEGCNSSHTGNMGATLQGFRATILNTAPVVWPLGPDGYAYDASTRKPMVMTRTRDLPVKTMADIS
ncbi:MAG: sugar phosphate isomerase/epimerase [Verrucomicrobiota bacterium]|nr:sugar phosphate isomerase/epimerase [Verrucomicrobiota bacterium]MDY5596958.1 sugar phosphate isomerase/epimerase [Kiritimatiellia bacterium]